MFNDFDLVVVGAGPVGCVLAERAASELKWRCLVIDKRNHIAGNCYDVLHPSGLLIHVYGPHYFRTDNDAVINYLSHFTDWIPGHYRVQASVKGALYPFPINLTTMEKYFGRSFTPESARAFLDQERVKIDHPKNSEEFVLSRVGRRLYEDFYLNYTIKQWGIPPKDLDPSVCGRIPVRFDRDDRYVEQKHQVMPKNGYTEMFKKMTASPLITTKLETDYFTVRDRIKPKKALVYCGPIDAFFDYRLGRLGWRSIEFTFKEFNKEFEQPCVQLNYPNEGPHTRSVEIKHVTGQKNPRTVVSYETPRAEGDPYYPIPTPDHARLYRQYE